MTDTDRSRRSGVVVIKTDQFLLWLAPTLEIFPKSQKFLLADRIQTFALDVLEGLVEATYTKNVLPLLRAANLRLATGGGFLYGLEV
jgi:hypothetical protein